MLMQLAVILQTHTPEIYIYFFFYFDFILDINEPWISLKSSSLFHKSHMLDVATSDCGIDMVKRKVMYS